MGSPVMIRAAAVLLLPLLAFADDCKVVETQPNFNISAFTGPSNRWYVQEQMVIAYLKPEDFFCVYAEYEVKDPTNLKVHNYLNEGSVNGKAEGPTTFINAYIKDPKVPAKLEVGPWFLPKSFYGPYWVVAAGADSSSGSGNEYDWALISGGQPTIKSGDGCKTGSGVNNAGLWIFTRAKERDNATVAAVRKIAAAKGFDLSVLHPVTQTGCEYRPAKTVFGAGSVDDLEMLVTGEVAGKDVTLYKISGDPPQCGQATLDAKYAKPAEKFAGLSEGNCPDNGFTHFVGNQTLTVPVLGKIIIQKYDNISSS